MENRVGKSHGVEIPKKSRSLDLKSLYESKNSKGDQNSNNLKRKGGGVGDDEKGHEKKKSRKELSISSFKNVNSSYSKSLKAGYNGSLSSGSKDSKSGLIQRLADSNGFSGASLPLEDGVVKIPRRKRGFVGRKKVDNSNEGSKLAGGFGREAGNADLSHQLTVEDEGKPVENGSQELQAVGISGGGVGDVDQASKLTGEDKGKQVEPSKAKQKKGSDDLKENGNGELNGSRPLEEEDGHDGHSVATRRDSSLKKSHNSPLVDNNGGSSLKKSLRKRSRKKKDMVSDKKRTKESDPSIDTSIKISDVLHDEDEENLEENAAMMLSSRFDPSCTGFSSNSKASASPSKNGFREFVVRGSSYVSGSESSSVDTDGRVLRPRKQNKEKGNTRKRRHYYEIFSGDLDAHWVLNRRIKVFWPLDQSWYHGLVGDYDKERKLHHVKYDDRDEEWINLRNERFKLLLLPSEVTGKTRRKRSVTRNKHSDGGKEKLMSRKEKRDLMTEDDSYEGAYMDSEPIISWLARSTRRVKSSPLRGLKKQKTSYLSSTMTPLSSLNRDKGKLKLSSNSASSDSVATDGRSDLPLMESRAFPKASKLPIVYYRKRLRKTSDRLCHESKGIHISGNVPESDSSLVPLTVAFGALEGHDTSLGRLDPDEDLDRLDAFDCLWSTGNAGLLRLNISAIQQRWFRFKLSFLLPSVSNYYSFGSENVWLIHAVLLLQYGMLVTTWPRIHLEMLFVDNMVGLRFLLFEGCLRQAVAFVFLVLTVFHQPNEQQGKCADFQLPITSIRFKFSCTQDFRKQFTFALYNFSEVENSKWMYLDHKLKRHCLLSRQLPLPECTYDNIKALQCGTNLLIGPLVCSDATLNKVSHRSSRQSISLLGVSRNSTYVNASQSSAKSDKNHRCLPSFALSFTAAPTFFLGLHLKMLMEHSVTHINFRDHDSIEHPEKSSGLLADNCCSVEDCSKACLDGIPGNDFKVLSRGADFDGCISRATKPESQAVDVSICNVGVRKKSSLNQGGDVNVEVSPSFKDLGELGSDAIAPLQNLECNHTESQPCDLLPRPSVNKDETDTGSHTLPNGITVEIPSVNQFDQHVNKELHGVQQLSDLSRNMNGGVIPSPNPTARRSTWHRNRSSSVLFGWSDGRADFLQNNFGNGPKKPRTQVSYALPFGSFDYSPRNKGNQQRGLPHKRIRTATEKRTSDISRGSERNLELLSCDANVLISNGDKGWRECGVQVGLELFDRNEWRLGVKLSGTTKYSYKAHQFLQTGSTNRYTHAIMWKGGKDWTLEFPDRSQWALFKEMHEECYNRNIRAASVKNIPIPGVRLIEENDDNGIEIPFFRGCKYFRQLETDVEMALDPSRVLYDMDSDDEQWMLKNRSPEASSSSWKISEVMFEKAMDVFEKAAYSQQRDQFTFNEMVELMTGIGPTEAINTIHEYWQHKRQRKRMPLIRHLQPPLWERYQQQLREWEQAMTRSNTGLPNGCHAKVALADKPPMYAFCLKPRGLEVPNKGSKQRSHRKFSVAGQSNAFAGDHDGLHPYGRRTNGFASGDEKTIYPAHNIESFDDSPLPQISPRMFSPRDACGPGYFSMTGDRYDRNHLQKLCRTKSKKLGTFVSSYDTQVATSCNQRMLDQRNGFHQWNAGFSNLHSQRHHQIHGYVRHGLEQLNGSDLDEFRLRDASGAAKHALNMAKLKRERAQRLLYRADLAIHKAVVALMNAEAIKTSSEDLNGDG